MQTNDKIEEIVQAFFKKWPSAVTHPTTNGIGDWLRRALLSYGEATKGEAEKAFGGCKNCYGKGYSTQMTQLTGAEDFGGDGFQEAPKVRLNYCKCERGSALKKLLAPLPTNTQDK